MANFPPMPTPASHTPRNPPPPPSYLVAVAQQEAIDRVTAKSNAAHTGGGCVHTISKIKLAHHPDESLPTVLAAPIHRFSSTIYHDAS